MLNTYRLIVHCSHLLLHHKVKQIEFKRTYSYTFNKFNTFDTFNTTNYTGADVSYKNTNGDTVLMKACEKGNENIMGKLLAQFTQKDILTSLTAQNKDGNTCLMKACATGNLKVIHFIRW